MSTHDVLDSPLFTLLADGEAVHHAPLPEVIARLLQGPEVLAFPALTAEQRSHWWRFLVRCGARALRERGASVEDAARVPDLAAAVREVLAAAAPPGAWQLHQGDPARAAFLQPPTPLSRPVADEYAENPPSLLTGTLGIKNHERKADVVRWLTAEQAVYALVEYQTAAVFGGRGNYGSQLMGSISGAGSGTPFMGVRIADSNVETYRHDVRTMLEGWDAVRRDLGLEGPVWALWAEPWDGEAPLSSRRLDPAFLPLARLVRLAAPDEEGRYHAVWFRTSSRARVEDVSGGGWLGDAFTPLVDAPDKPMGWKVRGTLRKGYDYTEVAGLLLGEVSGRATRRSPSVEALLRADDGSRRDLAVVFEGVAYEQGKTGGFHRRQVPLPPGAAGMFAEVEPLRQAHATMLARVRDAKSALRGAARLYVSGDLRPREGDGVKAELPAAELEARVDPVYLAHLFGFAPRQAADDGGWVWEWGARLRELAREAFRSALPALPGTLARRFERETAAWSFLEYRLAGLADPDAVLRRTNPSDGGARDAA